MSRVKNLCQRRNQNLPISRNSALRRVELQLLTNPLQGLLRIYDNGSSAQNLVHDLFSKT